MRWESFKFCDLVCLILEILRYIQAMGLHVPYVALSDQNVACELIQGDTLWLVSIWNGGTSYSNTFALINNFQHMIFNPSESHYIAVIWLLYADEINKHYLITVKQPVITYELTHLDMPSISNMWDVSHPPKNLVRWHQNVRIIQFFLPLGTKWDKYYR